MDRHLKDLKRVIKVTCKTKFITYCRQAGLSEEEIEMLIPFFYESKTEDYIADSHNLSKSSYQKKKRILLMRLLDYKNTFITL